MHQITPPREHLRSIARTLLDFAPPARHPKPAQHTIKVVCIADTHNHRPILPPGDVLLHAGDLTKRGSFKEIQAQLSWISSQPHTFKVVIAGNQDVLFDKAYLAAENDRFSVTKGYSAADLDFGSVIYLQDSATTLDFPELGRRLTVHGSPWTPQHMHSAFQYPRNNDFWSKNVIPDNTDILLTHGPPWGHLDGALHLGCRYLAQAVEELRPRLVVCGHVHAGYGEKKVRYDNLRRLYDDVERGWSGWGAIPLMLLQLVGVKAASALRSAIGSPKPGRCTQLINAAVVGDDGKVRNLPVVTYI